MVCPRSVRVHPRPGARGACPRSVRVWARLPSFINLVSVPVPPSARPRVGSCGDHRPRADQRDRQGVSLLSQVLGHRVRRRGGDADRCRRSVREDRAGSRTGARQAHVLRSDVRGAVQEHHPADPRMCAPRRSSSWPADTRFGDSTSRSAVRFTTWRPICAMSSRRSSICSRTYDGGTTSRRIRCTSVTVADVLDLDQLRAATAGFERDRPLMVLCEGLVGYLTREETGRLTTNVHSLLAEFSGGWWIVPDFAFKTEIRNLPPERIRLREAITGVTQRQLDASAFEDGADLEAFLHRAGFDMQVVQSGRQDAIVLDDCRARRCRRP